MIGLAEMEAALMSGGRTRKMSQPAPGPDGEDFMSRFQAAIVILSGEAAGSEFPLEQERVSVGRGPGVDIVFNDACMSRQHAAFELADDGFRVRDLGSTNGVQLNGVRVEVAELKHGDGVHLGELALQYILRDRSPEPPTYVLPES